MKKFIKNKIISIIKGLLLLFKAPVEVSKKNYLFKFNNILIKIFTSSSITYRRWVKFQKDGKEKETIEWINSFEEGSIFFDIGANVGVFSIYGALKKKLKVYSFEPDPNSFIELYNASKLNDANIVPLLIALDSDKNSKYFNMLNFEAGLSDSFLSKKKDGESFMLTTETLDNLIEGDLTETPDYIKIDVDGNEKNILNGMSKTIRNEKLKSILIEIDKSDEFSYYEAFFKEHNFKLELRNLESGNNIFTRQKKDEII